MVTKLWNHVMYVAHKLMGRLSLAYGRIKFFVYTLAFFYS